MMVYLSVDGRIYFGSPPSTIPLSKSMRHIPTDPQPAIDLPTRSLHHLCTPGSWEYNVARLLQRVQEARELLHEDLQEISEPLTTLVAHQFALLPEQHAVVLAVEQDYQQACQMIDQVLAHMLQHFPTEIAILAQLQNRVLSQAGSISDEPPICLQEEQIVEVAMR
jgi:hypothetical protein